MTAGFLVTVNAEYIRDNASIVTGKDSTSYWRIWNDGFIEHAGFLTNRSGEITTKVKSPYYANIRCFSPSGGDDNDYGAGCVAGQYSLKYQINFGRAYWDDSTKMYWKVCGFI